MTEYFLLTLFSSNWDQRPTRLKWDILKMKMFSATKIKIPHKNRFSRSFSCKNNKTVVHTIKYNRCVNIFSFSFLAEREAPNDECLSVFDHKEKENCLWRYFRTTNKNQSFRWCITYNLWFKVCDRENVLLRDGAAKCKKKNENSVILTHLLSVSALCDYL